MKKLILIAFVLVSTQMSICQTAIDSIWCNEVRSVFLTRGDIELERPIIPMGNPGEPSEQLMLRFDILEPQPGNFRYRIRHCDADWNIDNLEPSEFINGMEEGDIENYQFSFNTLQNYVNYYQPLPSRYSAFTASGNYVLEIYYKDNPDSIILTKRFCVFENLTNIEATISKPSGAYGNINRDQEISIGITPRDGSFLPSQAEYYRIIVQQNRREDLKRTMPFSGFSGNTMMYRWHAENVFPGGNSFRYFDLSNMWAAMYHVQRIEQWGGENFAFLQPEEDRSDKVYTQYSSLNGGMKINIRERREPQIEADYVWVNFSFPMERPFLNGNIYILGDITQWRLDDDSRMEWNAKYKAYTKRMLLKQGYYSYQLVFLPTGETEGLTATLEGDHFAMPNNYTVYVYLRQPGSRYDRLVGYGTYIKTDF
ncbi:MAG: DUF5103 domain-containing protein [Bacteroidales bacterium]|nr:DUF5103 domain-containing protein [Bacteroidales bacterium]